MIFCFQKHFVLLELGLFGDDGLTFDGAFCGGFWPNVDATIVVQLPSFHFEVAFQFFWPQRLHPLLSLEPLAFRHDGGACTGPYEHLSCDESICEQLSDDDGLYGETCFEQSSFFGLVELPRRLHHPLGD